MLQPEDPKFKALQEKIAALNDELKALSKQLSRDQAIAITFQHNPVRKIDDVDDKFVGMGADIISVNK